MGGRLRRVGPGRVLGESRWLQGSAVCGRSRGRRHWVLARIVPSLLRSMRARLWWSAAGAGSRVMGWRSPGPLTSSRPDGRGMDTIGVCMSANGVSQWAGGGWIRTGESRSATGGGGWRADGDCWGEGLVSRQRCVGQRDEMNSPSLGFAEPAASSGGRSFKKMRDRA